jgi:hypothetical protein
VMDVTTLVARISTNPWPEIKIKALEKFLWLVDSENCKQIHVKSSIVWDITPCSLLKLNSRVASIFQQTTRCFIPEDTSFHNHNCENLKSEIYV